MSFSSSCYHEEFYPYSTIDYLAGIDENGKSWKITGIEVTGLGKLSPFDCTSDNNIVFYREGRFETSEGYLKCDPKDPPAYVGTWNFNAPKDSMLISLEDSIRMWSVDQLTFNKLRITSRFAHDSRTYVLEER